MKAPPVVRTMCVCLAIKFAFPQFLLAEAFRVGPADELRVSIRLRGGVNELAKLPINGSLAVVGDKIYSQYDVRVGPDGTMSLPMVPSLQVGGMTLVEIENAVAGVYCAGEEKGAVSVSLLQHQNPAYFIAGEVGLPGRYVMQRPLTVLEAVVTAGGPTSWARLKEVHVLRTGSPTLSLDLSLLRTNEKNGARETALSYGVQPNDTIVVPRKRGLDQPSIMLLLTVISVATGIFIAVKMD